MDDVLRESRDGTVATLQLHRPEAINALDAALTAALLSSLPRLDRDPEVRAIVLTGAGRGFCAGADVRALAEAAGGASTPAVNRQRMRAASMALAMAIVDVETPLVAAVRGPCAGAGFALALACDLVIAGEGATFTVAFVRRGLVPDYGTTYLLPRLVGLRAAKELCLLGETVAAADAQRLGLATRVVPDDEVDAEAAALAARLAAGPTQALALTKRLLTGSFEVDHATAVDREFTAQALALAGEDSAEGAASFLEKRKPRFTGR
ncbi:MAG: enoyl-CoA hydratase/isomerase family protein [Egibacteraceae bacterium]